MRVTSIVQFSFVSVVFAPMKFYCVFSIEGICGKSNRGYGHWLWLRVLSPPQDCVTMREAAVCLQVACGVFMRL